MDACKFWFVVDDVFELEGRGTVVTGRIIKGKIKINDNVEILGDYKLFTIVSAIEKGRTFVESAEVDDYIGILIEGVKSCHISIGAIIVRY